MNELSLAPERCTGLKKSEILLKRIRELGIKEKLFDGQMIIPAYTLNLSTIKCMSKIPAGYWIMIDTPGLLLYRPVGTHLIKHSYFLK